MRFLGIKTCSLLMAFLDRSFKCWWRPPRRQHDATLAMLLCRRIAKCMYRRRHSGLAMGRRLGVRLYWMWRNGCEYSPKFEFGSYAGQLGTGHGVK